MLTDKDREWLERREERGAYYCYHCTDGRIHFECMDVWSSPNNCPLEDAQDFRDAAEFEARVAATIARGEFYRPCHSVDIEKCAYPVEGNCCVCHIKYARLAVEEEMQCDS